MNRQNNYTLSLALSCVAVLSLHAMNFKEELIDAIDRANLMRVEELLKQTPKPDPDALTAGLFAASGEYVMARVNYKHAGSSLIPTIINMLIKRGAKINVQDKYGETPLMRAAYHGNNWAVGEFLKHGADVTIKDKKGQTALDWAEKGMPLRVMAESIRKRGYQETIDMLTKAEEAARTQAQVLATVAQGNLPEFQKLTQKLSKAKQAPLLMSDKNGNTPLHIAVLNDKPDIVGYILSINPQLIGIKNKEGQTPLDLAVRYQKSDILKKFAALAEQQPTAAPTVPPSLLQRIKTALSFGKNKP